MTVRPYWVQIFAFIVAVIASYVALFHADQPLLEREAFRQTQTALTSYWMIKEGWQLAYQTPMLGYPWTIPLEFPFYQSIVAFITLTTGFSLDAVGRLVSFGFSLACAWPAFAIARRLKLTSTVAWIFCALLWSSPQYLYWGRTFLMETAAVFFTLAAVPYALDLRDHSPKWSSVLLFGMFASLGLLQKGTTAAPVLLVLGLLICITHLRRKPAIWHRRCGASRHCTGPANNCRRPLDVLCGKNPKRQFFCRWRFCACGLRGQIRFAFQFICLEDHTTRSSNN